MKLGRRCSRLARPLNALLVVWALLGTEAASAECPQPDLSVSQVPVLVVDKDTSTASTVIHICNHAKTALLLNLSATDFRSVTTTKYMGSSSVISAADAAAKPYLAESKPLEPTGCANVKLDVSKLWEAGESKAALQQDLCTITELTAVKYRVPFSVKSGTPTTEKEDALFYRTQRDPTLSLRNDDPMTYPVVWQLILEGQSVASGEAVLPPNSSLPVRIPLQPPTCKKCANSTPPSQLFSWPASGTIQDDLQSGRLVVQLKPSDVSVASLPSQEIPVKVRLRYWNRGWQQLWNLLWIVFVLALGAMISIALNIGIPNQLKRNALRKQIADLDRKMNLIAPTLNSSELTFLRVESQRLKERLADDLWFSPNLAADLPQLQQALGLLATRVAVVQQIAQIREALWNAAKMPPFLLDSALSTADRLQAQATCSDLSDATGLSALVDSLRAQVASSSQANPTLEAAILASEAALRTDLGCKPGAVPQLEDTPWKLFLPDLQHLFASLAKADTTVQPSDYYERDMVTQAVGLLKEFLWRYSSAQETDRPQMEKAGNKLKTLLRQGSYANLVKARILVNAVRENIYEETLLIALRGGPSKVSLRAIPKTPLTFETALFEVWFAEPDLNTAAARNFITCEWDFSEDRASRRKPITRHQAWGWAVSHYFTKPCDAKVTARFRDSSQNCITEENSQDDLKLTVDLSAVRRPRSGHIGLEILRSSLALFVALVVLISGAQDKIATLPLAQAFLAVLVIGLTADTVKNLLVKSSSS